MSHGWSLANRPAWKCHCSLLRKAIKHTELRPWISSFDGSQKPSWGHLSHPKRGSCREALTLPANTGWHCHSQQWQRPSRPTRAFRWPQPQPTSWWQPCEKPQARLSSQVPPQFLTYRSLERLKKKFMFFEDTWFCWVTYAAIDNKWISVCWIHELVKANAEKLII